MKNNNNSLLTGKSILDACCGNTKQGFMLQNKITEILKPKISIPNKIYKTKK